MNTGYWVGAAIGFVIACTLVSLFVSPSDLSPANQFIVGMLLGGFFTGFGSAIGAYLDDGY